ncbi:class I adenylate-forming enzyme family protein [Jiangella asiatica]|uniref:Long-chain fatty acid--CoA ligase n=1 Tax=Jiangella asiatica TaxID=2530372 RepID=A0A4R5D6Y0_9ACTN|nr:class I adenylate-forming enzyme family protein [Jiangella asiatica]TDE08367.1 long-chain fatty acid--CoA ligase [Jiangella asiatica]
MTTSRWIGGGRSHRSAPAEWGARADVDDFRPPWEGFEEFFATRVDDSSVALVHYADGAAAARWTGGEWHAEAWSVARRLARAGVRSGDDVAIVARNSPTTLLAAFACWCLGAVFVPLDPRDSAQRNHDILAACDSPCIIGGPDSVTDSMTPARARVLSADDIFDVGVPAPDDIVRTPGAAAGLDVPALRLHTSGTSGTPKPIVLTMRSLLINCDAMTRAFGWNHDTMTLTILPISHANGLVISSILPWFTGGSSVLVDRFRTRTFWRIAAETSATACSLVPTVMEYLLADTANAAGPRTTLREVISGSGPLRPAAAAEFEKRFGVPVRQLYGLSETSAVLTVTPRLGIGALSGDARASVGPTVPHARVSVLRPDGTECAEHERGEIVARGGMLMLGYHGLLQATAEAFDGGWFHTGDRGYYRVGPDGQPWFILEGRTREVISRGGSTILPQHVDQVLDEHPSVARAATFGFANRWYGYEVAAVVVRRAPVQAEELIAWCRERMGFEAAPKVVMFDDELPLTTVGKIRRRSLADHYADRLASYWDHQFRPGHDDAWRR